MTLDEILQDMHAQGRFAETLSMEAWRKNASPWERLRRAGRARSQGIPTSTPGKFTGAGL